LIHIADKTLDLFCWPLNHPAADVNKLLDEFTPKSLAHLESQSRYSGTRQHIDDLLHHGKVMAVGLPNGEAGYIIHPEWLDRMLQWESAVPVSDASKVPLQKEETVSDASDSLETQPKNDNQPELSTDLSQAGTDIFGRKYGHGAAHMNTFLSEAVPRTVKVLTELSGYQNTPSHILQLRREGKIEAVFLPDGQVGWVIKAEWLKAAQSEETSTAGIQPAGLVEPSLITVTQQPPEPQNAALAVRDESPANSNETVDVATEVTPGRWRRPVRGGRSAALQSNSPLETIIIDHEPAAGAENLLITDREATSFVSKVSPRLVAENHGNRRDLDGRGLSPIPELSDSNDAPEAIVPATEFVDEAQELAPSEVSEEHGDGTFFRPRRPVRRGRPRTTEELTARQPNPEGPVYQTPVFPPKPADTPFAVTGAAMLPGPVLVQTIEPTDPPSMENRNWLQALSSQQRLVFEIIENRLKAGAESPTIREIQTAAMLSHFETLNQVDALVRRGVIEFDRSQARGIQIIPESERSTPASTVQQIRPHSFARHPEPNPSSDTHLSEIGPRFGMKPQQANTPSPAKSFQPVLPTTDQKIEWVESLLQTEALNRQYATAGRRAPGRDQLRTLLVLLAHHGYAVHRETLCNALNLPVIRYAGFISMMMRLLNLDSVAILTRDDSGEMIRINMDLLCRQFGVSRI
jgi:hypothetical protein